MKVNYPPRIYLQRPARVAGICRLWIIRKSGFRIIAACIKPVGVIENNTEATAND